MKHGIAHFILRCWCGWEFIVLSMEFLDSNKTTLPWKYSLIDWFALCKLALCTRHFIASTSIYSKQKLLEDSVKWRKTTVWYTLTHLRFSHPIHSSLLNRVYKVFLEDVIWISFLWKKGPDLNNGLSKHDLLNFPVRCRYSLEPKINKIKLIGLNLIGVKKVWRC